jgi:ribosomal protein S18 acetylase RimI-like enzyme
MSDAPTDLLVRWATRWDREALTRMVVALAIQHHVHTTPELVSDAFDYALAHPDHVRFCVAERAKSLVGVASVHTAFSTWRSLPFGTIEDVYVEPDARRSGVASAMLQFLFDHAGRRGFCRLQLDVQGDNEGACAFYESIGMSDSGYRVYVAGLLDEPAEAT